MATNNELGLVDVGAKLGELGHTDSITGPIQRLSQEILQNINDIKPDSLLRTSAPLMAGIATGLSMRIDRLNRIALAAQRLVKAARYNLNTPPDVIDDLVDALSDALSAEN